VNLTDDEQAAFDGKAGEARKFAMRILSNIGELFDAPRLVPVRAASVNCPAGQAGTDGWTALIKYYTGRRLKAAVPAFADPDIKISKSLLNSPAAIFDTSSTAFKNHPGQREQLAGLYKRIGFNRYRLYPATRRKVALEGRTHMAVSDPATAVFLNSRYSIRTNAESSAVALASTVLGKTTLSGLHLLENRVPDVHVRVDADLSPGDLTLLGLYFGKKYRDSLPYFKLKDWNYVPSEKELFEFASALSYSGNIPMFHIEDLTPEYHLYRPSSIHRKVKIKSGNIEKIRSKYSTAEFPELAVVGAPQASLENLLDASRFFSSANGRGPPLFMFTTKEILKLARKQGAIKVLENAGVTIFTDCKFSDLPVEALRVKNIMSDSAGTLEVKRTHKRSGFKIKLAPTNACLEVAASGVLPE
jgi:predicted aconitase